MIESFGTIVKEGTTLIIRPFDNDDAVQIAHLLNCYLPFEEENEETIKKAEGIRYVCEDKGQIIGYIAGITLSNSYDEMPYHQLELQALHDKAAHYKTIYTTHLVVHPDYRGAGIGCQLVDAYMTEVKKQAQLLIVVGWVKSDSGRWDAERLFTKVGLKSFCYISRYFEAYNVYCPNCSGVCYCDAHIHWLEIA